MQIGNFKLKKEEHKYSLKSVFVNDDDVDDDHHHHEEKLKWKVTDKDVKWQYTFK